MAEAKTYRKQEQEPARAEVTEVGPGVLRMQLPMRMPGLGHVNAYALLDDHGAAVVDPGVPGPGNWKALLNRLRQAELEPRHVHTVLVTHSHIDHFGSAARLAALADAEFIVHADFAVPWMGVETHHCADVDDAPTEISPDWHRRTPWGGEPMKPPRSRRAMFWVMRKILRRALLPPLPTRRVAHGDVLRLGGRDVFARHTPGHTLDHLCLHDPEGGLLFSGDHVLPTITPHISGVGTGDDPLKAFVGSLDAVADLEGVTRVLPAHGHPFDDLPKRVDEIKEHHDHRLERLREAARDIGRPATVRELSRRLFRKQRWGPMAESETYAHLEHLRLAGEAERSERHGVLFYQLG